MITPPDEAPRSRPGGGGGGADGGAAGVRAATHRRRRRGGSVVHGVAGHQLRAAVPRLRDDQQQQRPRRVVVVVVPDGRLLPRAGRAGERQRRLRVPRPHRQPAARRARQPVARRRHAQGLQRLGGPAPLPRCDHGGSDPGSSCPRRRTSRSQLPAATTNYAGA